MQRPPAAFQRRATPARLDLDVDPLLQRAARLAAGSVEAALGMVVRAGRVEAASVTADVVEAALAERVCMFQSPLLVPDLRKSAPLRELLPASGHERARSLAGASSSPANDLAVVVIDSKVRKWTKREAEILTDIARGLAADLALRLSTQHLVERQSELAELLDHTNELVCSTDLDGALTFVNAAWVRALGYDADVAETMGMIDLVAPGYRARYDEVHRRTLSGEEVPEVEMVLVARDGHRVVCRGRVTPRRQNDLVAGARHAYLDVTEARRAEAVRARLAATLEATTDLVGITTQDGRLVYLNTAGRALLGLSADADLSAVDFRTMPVASEREFITRHAIPAAVQDGTWEGESAVLGPGGEEIPVSLVLVAHPSTWPGEPPYFISAVMRDLRERVSVERALRESESRKKSMLDTALDCVVTVDHEGLITEFNPAAETTFGYLREEALGRRAVDLLVPERLRASHPLEFDPHLATGEAHMLGRLVQMPALRGDGSEFICEFSITRLPIDGPPTFTAFMRDITARKLLEESVVNEREFLIAVLENLSEGVAVADASGRPTLINRALRGILGMGEDPKPRDPWPPPGLLYETDGFTPIAPANTPLMRAHRGETVRDSEVIVAHPSGEVRTLLASGRRIVDRAGAQLGAVVALHDVTERRRAERLKSQLIRTVSHELRTPLTAIRGALDMLSRRADALDESGKTLLTMATRNVSHLARMVNDLLDVERIESGATSMEREWLDARHVMETAREITHTVAEAAGVRIEIEGPSMPVYGDADRLVQVFTNLIHNAVKFSPRDSTVQLSVALFDDDTAICFTLRDQGRGIPQDRLDSIFEPFEQVEAADAQGRGGSGLGLTISRAIVRQHGGTIWAESAPGEGSTFRIVLPARLDEAGA